MYVMQYFKPAVRAGLAVLLGLGVCGAAYGADYEAALEKFRQYRAERRALDELLAKGIFDAAGQSAAQGHETKASNFLRQARTLFERSGAARSENPEIVDAYIEVLALLGDYDLAAEFLESAVKRMPESATHWARLGEYRAKLGPAKRRDATKALRKAIALDGASAGAAKVWYVLGDLYHREALYEFARESYEQALALKPDDVRTRIAMAALDTREGHILQASQAIDALGLAAKAYDAEARILFRRALADFQATRRTIPDEHAHHVAYARMLYRAARLPEAILAARRATELAPDDYRTWNLIAMWNGQLARYAAAREAFERSLEANPDQPNVRQGLAAMPADDLR